ncbi:hypothetical protein [Umezawaea sp. Da 62-37]|uniref:hypothetical protein n=1 Tax=Umezawaea sp. Da 62-37 TaxID=3075927 RepID=UPI0028F6DCC0|nr:hypothetical protein [Umezawaea sp. Da 62-37]WNV86563.1 hypothetical protein RM788_52045 [Umezawaea sp. Da 62-37]
MQEASPELVTALAQGERQNTTMTRLSGREVTGQVTSWAVDRAYDSDLPAPLRAITGSAAAELRLTLTGDGASTAAQLYGPYAPHATADLVRPAQSAVHGWGLGGDALPAFRGTIRDRVADSATGTVELSALDGAERLRDAARLPVAVSVDSTPISSGIWAVDKLLRDAGIHTAPPPRPDCILYASLHGGVTPDIGFYRTHANIAGYDRRDVPWEIAPYAGGLEYSIRWDPRTRTTVPGRSLFAETWLDSTYQPSAGARVELVLFFQADTSTNQVRFAIDFGSDQATVGTDSNLRFLFSLGVTTKGRWHIGAYWSFSGSVPSCWLYLAGPGLPGGYKEVNLSTFATMPTGSQLNYVQLNAGLSCEAVQVSTRSSRPTQAEFTPVWTRGAVLDRIVSQVIALPPVQGSAWEVITQIARAEQATAAFDELGVFRYLNNGRFTDPGESVLTVTSAREIASLRVSEAIDSVRNTIDVPYSLYTSGVSSTRFTDTTVRQIGAFGTLVLTFEYDVSEFDSPPPVVYASPVPTGSRVRFATTSAGGTGVHGAIESTTERDGSTLRITFTNRTSLVLYLATATGTPSLTVSSIQLATGSPTRLSLRAYDQTSRALYGPQVYQATASPWIQTRFAASVVADYLLAAATPLPVLGDVEILPDPRIQLGDLVQVIDTVGATLSTPAWVIGIRTHGDDTGRIRQILTLRATTSPGPPVPTGLQPDPSLDPDARALLAAGGIQVP